MPSLLDLVIMSTYLIIIFLVANYIKNKNIDTNPEYRYYVWGLLASIIGALALGLIYNFYYPGGDTTGYYRSSEAMVNLLFADPAAYFRLLLGDMSPEAMSSFTAQTGSPWYTNDVGSFTIVRITSIFTFFGFKSFFTTIILFASFFYLGYWKLYLLVCQFYKNYYKQLALPILFFPSVLLWGSGILKDTVTLSALAWFLYSAYFLVAQKDKVIKNLAIVILSGYVLLLVKPYIIVALMPAIAIWAGWNYIRRIDNVIVRLIASPLLLLIFILISLSVMFVFRDSMGVYGHIDGILQKAVVTYEDHQRFEQYGEHYYDLGAFDGTLTNFISKTPQALIAGIYRPFLWEAGNVFMFFSALENAIVLLFTAIVLLRKGIGRFLGVISKEPFIVFSMVFALIFAFAVGVTSANFGALVRLKIPMVPFFVASLVVVNCRYGDVEGEFEEEGQEDQND